MLEHELWLLYADYDLNVAKRALYGEYIAVPTALSLSQQAAEKAIKGYLVFKKHTFMRTHRIDLLIDQCVFFDPTFNELRLDATDLSPHVTISRYPDSIFATPSLDTAQIIYQKAEKIVVFVRSKL